MYLLGINLAGDQVETCRMGLMPATCENCFTRHRTASGVKAFLDNVWTDVHGNKVPFEADSRF